jgi:hypothetical protein
MTARRHTQSESFFTFANTIRSMNSLLVNTDSHLSDERLRSHLESAMCRDLLDDYRADPMAKAVDTTKLSLWLHEVKHIDDACLRGYLWMKAAVDEVERKLNKCLVPARGENNGTAKRPRADGPSNSSAGNSGTKCCPPLMEEEKKILDANQGCRRCRLPFQTTHRSSDKTCPFPCADPYVPVTQKFVDAFRKGKGKENAPAALPAAAAVVDHNYVAAVFPDIEDPNDSSGTTDGDLSGRNVSFPYKTPHLFGTFLMEGPAVEFPISVRALIDDGSHLVLITPELIDRLDLRRCRLHVPETVDVALSDSSTSQRTFTEYVHLRCVSTDSRWTSNTVRALIAPGLCAPIILGLPWLARNHIVIDHHA